MKKLLIASSAALLALSSVASATTTHHNGRVKVNAKKEVVAEQPKTRLGELACVVDPGMGMLIGSSKTVNCEFRQRSGKVERYTGSIGKLGIDVGYTGKRYLRWVVYNVNPTTASEGALAGTYIGASAGASVGIGFGANALVGGGGKNFGLQPLSAEAGTGLNIAAGVSRLQLKSAS